jgi:hypothetical protein
MTIYVDDARKHDTAFTRKQGRYWWCHMASDLPGEAGYKELMRFACEKLHLNGAWLQDRGQRTEHFDLTADPTKGGQKRSEAIRLGAVPVSCLEFARRTSLAKAGISLPPLPALSEGSTTE